MTNSQQKVLSIFTDAIEGKDHWHLEEVHDLGKSGISIYLRSDKFYQEAIIGRIGTRGAFYTWKNSDDGKLIQKRENAKIIAASVYSITCEETHMYKVIKIIAKASPVYARGVYLVRDENNESFVVMAGNKKMAAMGNIWGQPKPASKSLHVQRSAELRELADIA